MDVDLQGVIVSAIHSVSKRTQTMAITASSSLVDDLGLDSLDLVGVLMKLEDNFNLKIELDEVPNLQTVGEVAAHLGALLREHSAAA